MPGIEDWKPYRTHVQGGLREGNFLNGQFILLCAGPPFFNQLNLGADVGSGDKELSNTLVYPIGLTQNVSISQNKAISRIFEIGSDRSYFISGRSVGQLGLGRVVYHGPSLLRALYAYYGTVSDTNVDSTAVDPLMQFGGDVSSTMPFVDPKQGGGTPVQGVSKAGSSAALHGVRVPAGYDNMFINLASDLFSQPLGLLLIFRDNQENSIATVYLEQCYVPQHTLAVDSQGLIIQEQVGIQYERMVPVKTSQLALVSEVLADETAVQF